MAFSEGISRLQRIINLISIDYRSKKEIMAYLREYNIIISYKTLERDLKQIKEELGFDLEYKRNVGYRCENENVLQTTSNSIEPTGTSVATESGLIMKHGIASDKASPYFVMSSRIGVLAPLTGLSPRSKS